VQMFRDYRDRCTGFHFKDTHTVDRHEAYRTPPDPELMAPGVDRWFYEMGTDGGLVDFPALMREIVASGYDGWLTVEHDKAELGGGSYAEATCVAKWYIDNVLAEVRS
jgi:inosose dehydratase